VFLGAVPYLVFSVESLTERDIRFLSNMSSIYALFEVRGDSLRPLELLRLDRFDDDLLTIQKYAGKTNEHFTKLLVNLTILSTRFAAETLERKFAVFDPLCGRGSTLHQAMMFGFDAAGMEIDAKDFEAYRVFVATWLQQKRIKHQVEVSGRKDKNLNITLGVTKALYRGGDTIDITVVNADTIRALEFFRRGSFDVVVADAPYGVKHGSRLAKGTLSRRPAELLTSALPIWKELLRPGGAIGVAWNTRLLSRDLAIKMMEHAGFDVLTSDAYLGFEHRVDQAIVRDIVVARRS
jgi:tRNA G10  N-methylase Trm11